MSTVLHAVLRTTDSLHGHIRPAKQLSVNLPVYSGPYTAEPSAQTITLPTDGTHMTDNITILAIPFREEKNAAGGWTAIIGG